ncbi:ABC transporter substrate-binding protein [Neobacillus sp. NPDC097160]|uniref:ABC transporter substrate-binding protein n=1 Tax=Neobacillus sp. NPDC097160 TaxID=3364298 RepID=UPI00380F74A5
MIKRWIRNIGLLLVILVTITACSSKSSSGDENSKEPIVLGANLALTGPAGTYGTAMKDVFDFVIKQKNDDGGINGRKLKMVYYDDESKPEKTVQNFQKLIKKDGVNVIVGPSTTTTTVAVEPMIEKEKVIMFSGSNAYSPPGNSFAFNTSLKQPATHLIHHEWLKEKGIKKVGVMASTDESGNLSVNIIKNNFNKKDGIEYVFERMALDTVNVTAELTRLKEQGIEALVVIGTGAPVNIVLKGVDQLSLDKPVLLTQTQLNFAFADQVKDFMPKELYISGTPPMVYEQLDENNPLKPNLKKFAKLYKDGLHKEPDHLGAMGYDIITSVIKAIELAGSDDPEKMKKAFETKFKNMALTTSVVNYTPEDHQGTNGDGIVLIRLNQDSTWSLAMEPKFWEK